MNKKLKVCHKNIVYKWEFRKDITYQTFWLFMAFSKVFLNIRTRESKPKPLKSMRVVGGSSFVISDNLKLLTEAITWLPGGCLIGARPVNYHLQALKKMGMKYKIKKGYIIAKLSSKIIIAPFAGVVGKRGISGSSLGSENTIILTLDDSRNVLCDLKIPEVYAAVLKKNLKLKATFSAYKEKNYEGKIESVASRVDAQTRSILARAKIKNENNEIIPGSLLEIEIFYNEKDSLSVPDTSIIYEGSKKFIYKIIENNMIKKTEVKTGIRNKGNLEILSCLN